MGLSTLRNERAGTTKAEFTATGYLIRTVISKKEEKTLKKNDFLSNLRVSGWKFMTLIFNER